MTARCLQDRLNKRLDVAASSQTDERSCDMTNIITMKRSVDRVGQIRIVFLIFAIFGLIFSVVGTIICAKVFKYENIVETTAVITDFEEYKEYSGGKMRTHHKTHLTYEAEGISYTNVSEMYSSSWEVGEEIEIYYDIDDPQRIGSKSTDPALLVIPGLGILFLSVGVIALLLCRKKRS